MSLAIKLDQKYTYADYLTWPEDERWELIDGVPYNMSPAPNTQHQKISFEISGILYNLLKGKECRAFAAPFDVKFTEFDASSNKDIQTVVQPDIVVICDKKKLDNQGCNGAPDIVVEILSSSTAYKDEGEKLNLYEKFGVKEYWIVNPKAKYIMIYHHIDDKFEKPEYLRGDEILTSRVLEKFQLNLSDLWENIDE